MEMSAGLALVGACPLSCWCSQAAIPMSVPRQQPRTAVSRAGRVGSAATVTGAAASPTASPLLSVLMLLRSGRLFPAAAVAHAQRTLAAQRGGDFRVRGSGGAPGSGASCVDTGAAADGQRQPSSTQHGRSGTKRGVSTHVATVPRAPAIAPHSTTKLRGYDLYRKLGSPKYLVSPMVRGVAGLCRQ